MFRTKIALLGASLLLAGTSCQMMAKGPQLKAGMQRSAVGFGYGASTIESTPGVDVDVTQANLNVAHGWFVTGNAEIGGKLMYSNVEVDTPGSPKSESDSYILAAFARWYFAGGSNLYPYVEGLLGMGNTDSGATDDDFTRYSFGVGAMNFVTASTALDAILKYQGDSYDETNVDESGFWLELAYSVFW